MCSKHRSYKHLPRPVHRRVLEQSHIPQNRQNMSEHLFIYQARCPVTKEHRSHSKHMKDKATQTKQTLVNK